MNIISFPGLGIGEFELNKVAFTVFGRDIAWYGIIISLSIMAGLLYSMWRGKSNGINPDDMVDVGIFAIPAALVGARLYYVLFNLSSYKSFYDVIAVWNGGLAVYGGILGGMLAGWGVCKYKMSLMKKMGDTEISHHKIVNMSFLNVFDSVAPGIMIGQALGRWGNFANGEAFGGETSLPWRMGLMGGNTGWRMMEVHPAFLYESLWSILGFVLITAFYKKRTFHGQIGLMYLSWYGLGRFFIEWLRTDSLYLGPLRVSQALALVMCLGGAAAVAVILSKNKNASPLPAEVVPTEGKSASNDDSTEDNKSEDN